MTKFICPANKFLAVDVFRDVKTGQILKVVIKKRLFYKDEKSCASVAMGQGCKYYDKENHKCLLGWTREKLNECVEKMKSMFEAMGAEVHVVE